MSALEIRDLEVVYRDRGRGPVRAVAGASISVERGQIVGLVGESGCGKSSLAKAAVGLVPREAGEVLLDGRALHPLRRKARSRDDARIQMVFQNPFASLNPRRTIGAQIADGLTLAGAPSGSHREQTAALLDEVGIAAAAVGRYPHQFSGGQRQRIAIARALAADPSVVVLDEPLSSLDASAQAQAANLLVRLARDRGLALLLISHDLGIVNHVADVVSVMYLGLVVETAPTRALWEKPQHPYTVGLLASRPNVHAGGGDLATIPGQVPDARERPSGCPFHTRCPYAKELCSEQPPAKEEVGAGHSVACHFWREIS